MNPLAIAFPLIFYGFLIGYPLMQAYTLLRGHGAARIISLASLVFGLPFYLWSLSRVFGPQSSGDLSGLVIFFVGPWFLLVQGLLTGFVAAQCRQQSNNSAARNPGRPQDSE